MHVVELKASKHARGVATLGSNKQVPKQKFGILKKIPS